MENFKLPKKISFNFFLRVFVLISLKESYFFFRNLYGLGVHPFKTTVTIFQKPDWSQAILVFGLPAYIWFMGTIFFLPIFFFFRNHYEARIILLFLFYYSTFLLFLLGIYFLYWFGQYFFRCKLKQRN